MAGLLSCASERVFTMWSRRYHLTKEASRFIIASAQEMRFRRTWRRAPPTLAKLA